MNKSIIVNVFIIAVIVTAVFLSQRPYYQKKGKMFYAKLTPYVDYYLEKGNHWFTNTIYPKINSEIEKRGGGLTKEINNQKDHILQNVWDNINHYLNKKFSQTFGTEVK